ncbi:Rhamnogalacturonan endolyase YesW precursor [Posidoniimonas polymericola]|uniref:Rhamnogalacturonan endolyase YesW n=1 Tax=Posidoniimonas polymericola TaxID=2528002 RepID=A0A5C5YKU8_9BACT|nr:rhamnogalacturonan lyase [Posidoniimonas polymericola]TWT75545.1 Rhamnogalacturonan endolyase YesW precursor [Posidoniimonas polymericola]
MTRFPSTLAALLTLCATVTAERQAEHVTRGLVAVRAEGERVFAGWRLLASDPPGVGFNLYRVTESGERELVNDSPLLGPTSTWDANAGDAVGYEVSAVYAGAEEPRSATAPLWEHDYLEIPIDPIDGYRPGDASVGDLDGDGQFEIVLHQTSRGRDNGSAGVTGEPVLDAYRLDGTRLWRINLGKNIREGQHYTQFMVYDLDGDGRAEVACKTADGTTDGQGKVIGDPDKDWRTLEEGSQRNGRILDGPEYFTIFDGQTGAALATADFVPDRDPIDGWGGIGGNAGNDSYGNRCDRFLAGVAYLDGERPSVVMSRGVYGRTAITAWDWRDGKLSIRWKFDTGPSRPPYRDASPYAGMGGHGLSVGDIDADGRDEIVYQAMVVDDNGEGLYSTGLRHGDAMYLTDIDPERPGQEVFTIQENEEHAERFQTPAIAMRDAQSGELLWQFSPTVDAPTGMAADIDPRFRGLEMWGGPGGLRDVHGEEIGAAPRNSRWCVWWDGDPQRELFSPGRGAFRGRPGSQQAGQATRRPPRNWRWPATTRVTKWDWENKRDEVIYECDGIATEPGPALQGDLLGDWREELLLVSPDRQSLRLYTTTIPTEYRLSTLLQDPQYRLGLVWQNVVYNKPPQPSFFLADKLEPAPQPAE